MTRCPIAAALVTLAIALAGCSSGSGTLTSHGTLDVFANPLNGQAVTAAYPDVTSGSQVTVTDASGKVIGTGTLGYDQTAVKRAEKLFAAAIPNAPADMYGTWIEAFSFTVKVPAGESRYGIRAGQGRGVIWFTENQMHKGPSLTLGSMGG
jgi:hypothetical protein